MSWLDSEFSSAALPVAASLVTLWLSQMHARRTAREDRVHLELQHRRTQLFELREARYADRRSAVMAFIAAASDEADAVSRFEDEHPGLAPFDLHDDYLFPKLNGAYAGLVVVASQDVVDAAERLRQAVLDCFAGADGSWAAYASALKAFQDTARAMLVEDLPDTSDASPEVHGRGRRRR